MIATKRITIGTDFHVWHQGADGRFTAVTGLDLAEKLRLDLNRLGLSRFAHFAGDFDGDGRADFVHLGRGKKVTVHRGQPGARYAKKPDLVLEMTREIPDLELSQVLDVDGDARADLVITFPRRSEDDAATAPVELVIFHSGGE